MNPNWSGRRTLALVLVLSAVGFLAGILALLLLWGGLRLFGFGTDFWAMTEALATAAAAATVLGGGILAYRELSEASSSRHLAVADRLFEELNAAESIAARRWIFQNLTDDPAVGMPRLSAEGRDHVKRVLNSLDRVAFLTQAGWIPDEMVMPWMSPMVVKAWARLGPYVDHESRRRNEPDYYRQVRELAARCQAWRASHHATNEIRWVEDAL